MSKNRLPLLKIGEELCNVVWGEGQSRRRRPFPARRPVGHLHVSLRPRYPEIINPVKAGRDIYEVLERTLNSEDEVEMPVIVQ